MAKKKYVSINRDRNTVVNFFKNEFITALERDTISADSNYFYAETDDAIYKMEISDFKLLFLPTLGDICEKLERDLQIKDKVEVGIIDILYDWENPVFQKLEMKPLMDFTKRLKDRLNKDEEYKRSLKSVAYIRLMKISDIEVRKKYLERLSSIDVFDETDKINLEYYADAPISKIKELCESDETSYEQKIALIAQVYHYEKELQEKRKNKRKYSSRVVGVINLLDGSEIVDMYVENGLTDQEFIRTKIKKEDILSVSYKLLINFLEDKNSKMPENLKITSKDLINEYGRNYSGDTIYKLVLYGYIDVEDFIEVYEINKVLKRVDYNKEDIFEDEELKAFYSPEILMNMKKEGKLSPQFTQSYLELQDFENDKKYFKLKSELLVDEIRKNKENDVEKEVLEFFNIGFCDVETVKDVVSPKYIEEKYEKNEISKEEIFELYKSGIIGNETIAKFFTDRELIELYEQGEAPNICLRAVEDADLIIGEFSDGQIETQDFINLYLKSNTLTVTDINDGFELSDMEDYDISAFIDEETPFEKIKELFSNLLIDYASILRLRNQGIINEEQFLEIKTTLDTREFFNELRDGKKFKVLTSREGESSGGIRSRDLRPKDNEDFSDEIDLISKILQKDVENDSYSLIESYNTKGLPTSLNNYRIFGNEELDGIIILQKSKKGNAVFVMNALQMMYFLKGKENEDGEFEVKDRMKDKAYLKTIEGVEVIEHSKYFSRNLIDAASRISPTISDNMKVSERKYKKDVEQMIEDMVDKYLMERGKSR